MCGFAGIVGRRVDWRKIKQMTEVINHRGPDDQCFLVANSQNRKMTLAPVLDYGQNEEYDLAIGFNRLSIRDISVNGRQPMKSENGEVVLVFNGEIYNTIELCNSYLKNYTLNGKSDTEIILALYMRYGLDKLVSILNGMFAICIADFRTKMIYLVRDRMGIKPLYYAFTEDKKIMFASELKSFIKNDSFRRSINTKSLYEFFTFGDAIDCLLLNKTFEVEPGSILKVPMNAEEYNNSMISKDYYFELNQYCRNSKFDISIDEASEEFETLFREVIKDQMLSDVKVGCQLSGGIDSSLVAYYAKENASDFLEAVSIIPNDAEFSEKDYIFYLSNKIGLRSHFYDIDEQYIMTNFRRSMWHYETILTYHNTIALLKLTEEASKEVTVLLSGEGADELFGGYTWFEDGWFASQYFERASEKNNKSGNSWDDVVHGIRGLSGAKNYGEFAINATDTISSEIFYNLFGNQKRQRQEITEKRLAFFDSFDGSNFDKHLKYELTTRLRALLMRQDKSSMANSIENRVPFLDNRIIDFAFKLPQNYLLNTDNRIIGKYLPKTLCSKKFGEDFAFRRKVGFPLPFHKYLYEKSFKEEVYDVIYPKMQKRGIMDADYLIKMYEKLPMEKTISRWEFAPLWKAISFEIWCELFID